MRQKPFTKFSLAVAHHGFATCGAFIFPNVLVVIKAAYRFMRAVRPRSGWAVAGTGGSVPEHTPDEDTLLWRSALHSCPGRTTRLPERGEAKHGFCCAEGFAAVDSLRTS